MSEIKKGSFTVEAAALMGVVLLVIFSVLYAEFFVLNRDWLHISAYEAAMTGAMEERRKEGAGIEAARQKGKQLGSIGFFGLQDLNLGVTGGKVIKVTYTGKMHSILGGYQAALVCTGSYKVIQPVSVIRNIRMLGDLGM